MNMISLPTNIIFLLRMCVYAYYSNRNSREWTCCVCYQEFCSSRSNTWKSNFQQKKILCICYTQQVWMVMNMKNISFCGWINKIKIFGGLNGWFLLELLIKIFPKLFTTNWSLKCSHACNFLMPSLRKTSKPMEQNEKNLENATREWYSNEY